MRRYRILTVCLCALLFASLPAFAQETDCLQCHDDLKKEKVVHPALEMGCPACHTGIDASVVPHKITNAVPLGLSAEPPGLCYGCHDQSMFTNKTKHGALGMGCTSCHNPHSSKNEKLLVEPQPDLCYACHDQSMFTKKTVHAAIGMGCTSCHNPHSSQNGKLLVEDVPDLCFSCHDKADFSKAVVHPPVAAGMCLTCHLPHSSDQMALLVMKPYDLCISCHSDVPKTPHAVSVFSSKKRHPLGGPRPRKKKELKNPAHPDKPFYCGSCHNPHSTDGGRLFRFNAKTAMSLCANCHKM